MCGESQYFFLQKHRYRARTKRREYTGVLQYAWNESSRIYIIDSDCIEATGSGTDWCIHKYPLADNVSNDQACGLRPDSSAASGQHRRKRNRTWQISVYRLLVSFRTRCDVAFV